MKFIFKCEPSTKIHQTLTKFKTRLLLRREKKQRKKRRKGKRKGQRERGKKKRKERGRRKACYMESVIYIICEHI